MEARSSSLSGRFRLPFMVGPQCYKPHSNTVRLTPRVDACPTSPNLRLRPIRLVLQLSAPLLATIRRLGLFVREIWGSRQRCGRKLFDMGARSNVRFREGLSNLEPIQPSAKKNLVVKACKLSYFGITFGRQIKCQDNSPRKSTLMRISLLEACAIHHIQRLNFSLSI